MLLGKLRPDSVTNYLDQTRPWRAVAANRLGNIFLKRETKKMTLLEVKHSQKKKETKERRRGKKNINRCH